LAEEGISVEVIDPRTIFPLDLSTIVESVKKTGRLVITHEAVERGGFAAEVIAQVVDAAFDYLDAPIQRVCAPPVPTPFARNMEDYIMIDRDKIASRVRKLVQGRL
jgi:pyruvate dehydrogenase E1 component beta subunit